MAAYWLSALEIERFSFLCVGKIVNLAMKMTKDMPIMKRAFPKGSGVQTYCCLSNGRMSQEKQEWKGGALIFVSLPFEMWNHLALKLFIFLNDKIFIAFGFNWQFHSKESGRIWGEGVTQT